MEGVAKDSRKKKKGFHSTEEKILNGNRGRGRVKAFEGKNYTEKEESAG